VLGCLLAVGLFSEEAVLRVLEVGRATDDARAAADDEDHPANCMYTQR
jgi:hypothetical protein